jgi:hypothetical protein
VDNLITRIEKNLINSSYQFDFVVLVLTENSRSEEILSFLKKNEIVNAGIVNYDPKFSGLNLEEISYKVIFNNFRNSYLVLANDKTIVEDNIRWKLFDLVISRMTDPHEKLFIDESFKKVESGNHNFFIRWANQ